MSIAVTDYLDIQMRLSEFGLPNATGLTLLPTNLASAPNAEDLLQASEAATVRSLFRSAGLGFTELPDRTHGIRYIQNNAADWVGPTIFVAGSLWSQNPLAISVALSVVSNYLTDLFKGCLLYTSIAAVGDLHWEACGPTATLSKDALSEPGMVG